MSIENQVVEDGIERIAFQPALMIDKGAGATEFLDEHPIAQPLRGQQIPLVAGQPQLEVGIVRDHREASAWLDPSVAGL